jgi:hypothetical protein
MFISSFEYYIFYVLYPFVTYLLTHSRRIINSMKHFLTYRVVKACKFAMGESGKYA